MKHTPAPWKARPETRRYWKVERDGYFIATCWGDANATLIAAAPEMLASLERLLAAMSEYDPDTGKGERKVNAAANMARDVVIKAGGAA